MAVGRARATERRGGSMHRTSLRVGRVRSDTIAEGRVLLLDLDEVDQDVLAPESDSCVKAVGDGLVKRLLLRRRPAFIPGNLDNHEICTALDAEIFRIELETVSFVLSNDLNAFPFRSHRPFRFAGNKGAWTLMHYLD